MTNIAFVSAALVAATVLATQAMAARSDVAIRHTKTKDCVRAPNSARFLGSVYPAAVHAQYRN